MDIILNNKNNVPIYEQIYEQIVSQIINGTLKPNDSLPSIRTVARELEISVITIKNTYEKLETNGYIYTIAGKGSFISPSSNNIINKRKLQIVKQKLESQLEYFKSMGVSKQELIDLIDNIF